MKLKDVVIHKYKSFESVQNFQIEDDITILVGMNESGKTSALEAIGKTRYFQNDENFKFNATHDYPRKDKKKMEKSGDNPDAITCTYEIDKDLLITIENEMGKGVFKSTTFSITTKYDNSRTISISVDSKLFIELKTKELGISSETLTDKLLKVKNKLGLESLQKEYVDETKLKGLKLLEKYFDNKNNWTNDPIGEYIYRILLIPKIPKFLYYDEYYALPSRISIEELNNQSLSESELKTAKAFFELADINTEEIIKAESFEDFIAELEATQFIISEELFKYWHTNRNLKIIFRIDKKEGTDRYNNTSIVEHILDIRVENKGVTLPLRNRSKGFNWFFSFLVWFKKIQEDDHP